MVDLEGDFILPTVKVIAAHFPRQREMSVAAASAFSKAGQARRPV